MVWLISGSPDNSESRLGLPCCVDFQRGWQFLAFVVLCLVRTLYIFPTTESLDSAVSGLKIQPLFWASAPWSLLNKDTTGPQLLSLILLCCLSHHCFACPSALLIDEELGFVLWTSNIQFTFKELPCQEHWETIYWNSAHLGFFHLLHLLVARAVPEAGIAKINKRVSAF